MNVATVRRIGLFGGPILALICYYLLPQHYSTGPAEWVEFSQAGRTTLGMMVWMATWWLTEAVDIEVTALLPIVAFPLLGVAPLSKVLAPYAADVIFLFMGGFIQPGANARRPSGIRFMRLRYGRIGNRPGNSARFQPQ